MSQGSKGNIFLRILKWGALFGGLAIIYAMGQILALAFIGSVGYVGWQMMKGATWDRAAVMPAGLWGASYGLNNVADGQSGGPIDAVTAIVFSAITAMALVWLTKFMIGKIFR